MMIEHKKNILEFTSLDSLLWVYKNLKKEGYQVELGRHILNSGEFPGQNTGLNLFLLDEIPGEYLESLKDKISKEDDPGGVVEWIWEDKEDTPDTPEDLLETYLCRLKRGDRINLHWKTRLWISNPERYEKYLGFEWDTEDKQPFDIYYTENLGKEGILVNFFCFETLLWVYLDMKKKGWDVELVYDSISGEIGENDPYQNILRLSSRNKFPEDFLPRSNDDLFFMVRKGNPEEYLKSLESKISLVPRSSPYTNAEWRDLEWRDKRNEDGGFDTLDDLLETYIYLLRDNPRICVSEETILWMKFPGEYKKILKLRERVEEKNLYRVEDNQKVRFFSLETLLSAYLEMKERGMEVRIGTIPLSTKDVLKLPYRDPYYVETKFYLLTQEEIPEIHDRKWEDKGENPDTLEDLLETYIYRLKKGDKVRISLDTLRWIRCPELYQKTLKLEIL